MGRRIRNRLAVVPWLDSGWVIGFGVTGRPALYLGRTAIVLRTSNPQAEKETRPWPFGWWIMPSVLLGFAAWCWAVLLLDALLN